MAILRIIAGVIVGYLIFAISAVMLFAIAGIDPHAEAAFVTKALVVAFGAVFAFLGGYSAALIAGAGKLTANWLLAVIIAGFAAVSLLMSVGDHYTQIAAIVFFAPLSMAAVIVRRRSKI
ncbi:MAG: hypothetical protein ABJA02_08990 [Acidobacteriota bacterium]